MLTCNVLSSVCSTVWATFPRVSTSYLCLEQRVWQGYCCKGLVCLLDIDGNLVRRGWWRWLWLKGQIQNYKKNHRFIKQQQQQNKQQMRETLQNPQPAKPGIQKGQLLQPCTERWAVDTIYSSMCNIAPFYFLDGGGLILLVAQILPDFTRILWLLSWPRCQTSLLILKDFQTIQLFTYLNQWALDAGIQQMYGWPTLRIELTNFSLLENGR